MTTYNTILTSAGAAAIANAQAANTQVTYTHLAVGDGNGNPVTPTQASTALVREKARVAVSSVTIHPDNANWIVVQGVFLATVGGFTIREIGVLGVGGTVLMAHGNFPDTYKPILETENASRDLNIKMVIEVSNAAVVSLQIDPSVAVATNDGIAAAIAAHEASRRHPDGTTTDKGFVRLATTAEATAGTLQTIAVTPLGLATGLAALASNIDAKLAAAAVTPEIYFIGQCGI